jgi:two-component system response regulator FixJ
VIDDEREVRISLSFLLKTFGISSRPFSTAEDFLSELPALRPGCVIVDVRMPTQDGISMLTQMRSDGIGWPTIVITGHAQVPTAVRAMKLGVIEFLEKPFSEVDLLAALDRGFELLSSNEAEFEFAEKAKHRISRLTPRERLVLEALMQGLSNKQMAVRFGLSPRTVEMHRTNMLHRAGTASLAELISIAHAAGIRVPRPGGPLS